MLPLAVIRLPATETHDLKARLRRLFQQLSGTDGDQSIGSEQRTRCGLESLIVDQLINELERQATEVDPNQVLLDIGRRRTGGVHQDEFITAWKNIAHVVGSMIHDMASGRLVNV